MTNYSIKLMIQKQISLPSKALETLKERFEKKFFASTTSLGGSETSSPANARAAFESKFNQSAVEKCRRIHTPKRDEQDMGPVDWFVHQYFRDIVRSALSEIARHRKLAATVRSLRDKPPFFKPGRMILSGPIVNITETGCSIITVQGDEIPVPFDKRSKSREAAILTALAAGQQKYSRIRLKWHKEGYLDIDVRVEDRTPR
jgi:hypothetical protein